MKNEFVDAISAILKETYLEVANNFSVSDLKYDSDKVSVVASKFRETALQKVKAKFDGNVDVVLLPEGYTIIETEKLGKIQKAYASAVKVVEDAPDADIMEVTGFLGEVLDD